MSQLPHAPDKSPSNFEKKEKIEDLFFKIMIPLSFLTGIVALAIGFAQKIIR